MGLTPEERIRRDLNGLMKRVKLRGARAGAKGRSADDFVRRVDRGVEIGFVVECEAINSRYRVMKGTCGSCQGRKRCTACSGSGKKMGIFFESRCRTCGGSGVCRGCIQRGEDIIRVLTRVCEYAEARRGRSLGEAAKSMNISMEEVGYLQGILNIAREVR